MTTHGAAGDASAPLTILVYSDDRTVREQVRMMLGRRPAPELPPVSYVECATQSAVLRHMDSGHVDLAVLDGESTPSGGLGVCRQLKDEIFDCPPILVLTGRPQDGWLATWSRADAAVPHPLDPVALAEAVATLVRRRLSGLPVA